MKFGVRECANIVFRAKQPVKIGDAEFKINQPVLYIDSATTSSMEQSTTTVYAQGGRGNVRLMSWEGEKTLTFSFTDALLSPIGFSILSGAGLFRKGNDTDTIKEGEDDENATSTLDLVHFHMVSNATLDFSSGSCEIDLKSALEEIPKARICLDDAPIYIMEIESDGSLTGHIITGTLTQDPAHPNVIKVASPKKDGKTAVSSDMVVMVDYYIDLPGEQVWEADITPETFGGNYYVEADTLFRTVDGKDLPANLTFPNVKLQSNFTMTFAGTGDPSTFDFTMDAFPGYTYFDKKKKVMAVLQIIDAKAFKTSATGGTEPVMYHDGVDEFMGITPKDEGWTDYDDSGSHKVVYENGVKTSTNDDEDSVVEKVPYGADEDDTP